MSKREKTYEKLKHIDPYLAEEYLFSGVRGDSLEAILLEIRDLVSAPQGSSILDAIRALVAPSDGATVEPLILTSQKKRKRVSQAVSKEERQAIIERMAELGLEYSSKDSYKRMLSKVKRAEDERLISGTTPEVACVVKHTDLHSNSSFLITEEEDKVPGEEKERNVVTGW